MLEIVLDSVFYVSISISGLLGGIHLICLVKDWWDRKK